MARLMLNFLDMTTTTQTAAASTSTLRRASQKMMNRWFYASVVAQSPELGLVRGGDCAARLIGADKVEVHSAGRRVVLTVAQAKELVRAERLEGGAVNWLSADASAQVDMGKFWISHN